MSKYELQRNTKKIIWKMTLQDRENYAQNLCKWRKIVMRKYGINYWQLA